ncbi:MAG: branched-chain amino acid ABC transporter permease [Candidatus Bathyarchaeota archaeon]|nr:branched-chain amino acid ABC transporter permease [Candidatus Bathyarchaeota archaeon]
MFTLSGIVETLLWGVANGCIYILLATGLNIIFGVMKLVNFAHGQLLMIGAYVAFVASTALGLNAYLAILVAMGAVAVIGIGLERFTFRKVLGTDKLNEIFVSLGLIYVFENAAILLWGNDSQRIVSPYESLRLSLGEVAIGYDRIFGVLIVIAILIALFLLMKKTKIGLAMRATSQKSDTSMLMGINIEKVYIFTFALGAALAGVAGALYGIIFPFNPYIGALPTIKAFAIIILGGLGSIPGAVVGGLLYGIAENTAVYFLGGIWQDAIAFALLIAVLVLRPTGLFGEKGE